MANEVAKLIFKAETKELVKAEKILDKLGDSANDAAKDVDRLGDESKAAGRKVDRLGKESKQTGKQVGTMGKAAGSAKGKLVGLAGALVGVGSAMAFGSKFVKVNEEFAIMNAMLLSATGSAEAASIQFEKIKEFAATTPFALAQSVNGFVMLKNLGLDPSMESMRSFGNTAAAMGRDLQQMIEAVAAASTMEFERLKLFGIKAKQQTDTVSFTFQGTTTVVKKEADAIVGFLKSIGEEKFGTAMSLQASSFAGAMSNLSDGFDNLFREAGKDGALDEITENVLDMTEGLGDPMVLAGTTALAGMMASISAVPIGTLRLLGTLMTRPSEVGGVPDISGVMQNITPTEGLLVDMAIKPPTEPLTGTDLLTSGVTPQTPLADPSAIGVKEAGISPAEQAAIDEKERLKQLEADFQAWKADQELTDLDLKIMSYQAQEQAQQDHFDRMLEQQLLVSDQRKLLDETTNLALISGKASTNETLEKLMSKDLKITDLTEKQKKKLLVGTAGQMLSFFAGNSKKMFKIQKAAGIANAIVSVGRGVSKAMELSYPANLAAAANVAAKGASEVAKIKSVELGAGGSSSSSVGGGGSVPAGSVADTMAIQPAIDEPVVQAPQAINVTVDGSIDPTGARRIIEAINEATEDGLEINALVGT